VRYCDELCLNAHWSENHGRLCQPALFALSPDAPPPSSSSSSSAPAAPAPSPPPTLPVEQPLIAGDAGSGGGTAEESSTSTHDAAVLAVLIAAGVEDAHDVARGLHAEAFDVETLRISSFDDVEEFGVVDEATMQRIHDCLPPPAPPPSRELSEEVVNNTEHNAGAAATAAAATTAVAAAAADDDPDGPRPPSNLCCPITLLLFRDPVLCVGDGETYERSAIEEHIRVKRTMLAAAQEKLDATNGESNEARRALENGITSPMGHGTLESLVLVPVRAMRTVADDWREENGLLRGAGE
jgi:hypothetical protein